LVISQVTFLYITNKAKVLEEVWRVLKPGGKAFLHIDGYLNVFDKLDNYPEFLKINAETPRFIIYENKKVIKLSKLLKIYHNGYDIKLLKSKIGTNRLLIMKKNNNKNFFLGLTYDDNSSLSLHNIREFKKINKHNYLAWNGNMSVFRFFSIKKK
jgi:ubiquinone/menaquinone biosynthesis C-methylase UbiE